MKFGVEILFIATTDIHAGGAPGKSKSSTKNYVTKITACNKNKYIAIIVFFYLIVPSRYFRVL